ncbi:MAG: XRE family transcriptional regulator [Pseudomonadota bacterium]
MNNFMELAALAEIPADTPNLGSILKGLRKDRGWSVQKLADTAGLPQSTLSKVENGSMSLNYDKLLQVAAAFDVPVGRLFETSQDRARKQGASGRRVLDQLKDEDMSESDHYHFRSMCTDLKNRLMMPLLFEVGELPVQSPMPMINIVGERFAYVVSGTIDFHCEHYETVTLESGDAVYIDAAMPHAFTAPAGETAKVITILTSRDDDYLAHARLVTSLGGHDASDRYLKSSS